MRRGKGYTHWNPPHSDVLRLPELDSPRLITNLKMANRIHSLWASQPNTEQYANWLPGSETYGKRTKNDNRTKDDLEVVKVELRIR